MASSLFWNITAHYNDLGTSKTNTFLQCFPMTVEAFWSKVQPSVRISKASHGNSRVKTGWRATDLDSKTGFLKAQCLGEEATSASPGNLLGIQFPSPTPDLLNLKVREWGPESACQQVPRWFWSTYIQVWESQVYLEDKHLVQGPSLTVNQVLSSRASTRSDLQNVASGPLLLFTIPPWASESPSLERVTII